MGESDQDKAAQEYYRSVESFNEKVGNRFDPYSDPFSAQDKMAKLDTLRDIGEGRINRRAEYDINQGKSDTTASLASQGVTGGSLLQAQNARIQNNTNKERFGALEGLMSSRLGQDLNVMNQANMDQFRNTQAAQDVDFFNAQNAFRKMQMQGDSLQFLDDTTWLDDTLAIANTAAGIGGAVFGAGLPFGNLLGGTETQVVGGAGRTGGGGAGGGGSSEWSGTQGGGGFHPPMMQPNQPPSYYTPMQNWFGG